MGCLNDGPHFWVLEDVVGGLAPATCKKCGAEKGFDAVFHLPVNAYMSTYGYRENVAELATAPAFKFSSDEEE